MQRHTHVTKQTREREHFPENIGHKVVLQLLNIFKQNELLSTAIKSLHCEYSTHMPDRELALR
jgi:hypothetical protein